MKHTRFSMIVWPAALALGVAAAPGIAAPVPQLAAPTDPASEQPSSQSSAFGWTASYAQQKTRDDQGEARKEMKAGNQLSLREIERRVLPKMRGAEYLGPAYDAAAHAYRLKFIKEGRVMYVDVDARTGKIIYRSR